MQTSARSFTPPRLQVSAFDHTPLPRLCGRPLWTAPYSFPSLSYSLALAGILNSFALAGILNYLCPHRHTPLPSLEFAFPLTGVLFCPSIVTSLISNSSVGTLKFAGVCYSYAWILQDILGVAFCIQMMKKLRLPSLKVSTSIHEDSVFPFLWLCGNGLVVRVMG